MPGNDIMQVPQGSLENMAAECSSIPHCRSFNTEGWLKLTWAPTVNAVYNYGATSSCLGLYVKAGASHSGG